MKYETRFAEFEDEKASHVQGVFQGQAAAKFAGLGDSNGVAISCANGKMVSGEVGVRQAGSRKSLWLPGQSE